MRSRNVPKSYAVVVRANDSGQPAYAVRIGDALHDVEVQFPFIIRGELLAVARFDKVHDYIVMWRTRT